MTKLLCRRGLLGLICSALFLLVCKSGAVAETAAELAVLDANGDGILDPYEVLDVLLALENDTGQPPTLAELSQYATKRQAEVEEEMADMLREFDQDGDGSVRVNEVDDEIQGFLGAMDADGDGAVDLSEALSFDFVDDALASEAEIEERIDETFERKDVDRSGFVELPGEVDTDEYGRFVELDLDRDARVSREEAYTFWLADNVPVRFDVEGDTARMTGVITAELPATLLRLLVEHPEVEIIEMMVVPGSIDDDANVRAAMYVYDRGLTTKLNATSTIASGGTDFFLGGRTRIVEPGAVIGVHSWGGGGIPAVDVPRDDPVHELYLEFYEAVGVPAEFYWFTLEAAPARGMHIMTDEELARYRIRQEEVER